MARSRNIKPGFFKNEDLSDVARDGRLLFIGLWTLCDCRGVVEDRPKRIRAEIFPYDDITVKEIDNHLSDLQTFGFLKRYKSEGISLIFITKFKKHQSPHPGEKQNGFNLPSETKNKDVVKNVSKKSKLLSEDITDTKSVTSKLPEGASKGGQQDMKDESCILKDESLIMKHDSDSNLSRDDPNFQNKNLYSAEDVAEICQLSCRIYKNTQFPNQVDPFVHNLLAQLSKDTMIQAIQNVSQMFDRSKREHDKRPNFGNMFTTPQAVKEMAERPVSSPEASEEPDQALLETRAMMKREDIKLEKARKERERLLGE